MKKFILSLIVACIFSSVVPFQAFARGGGRNRATRGDSGRGSSTTSRASTSSSTSGTVAMSQGTCYNSVHACLNKLCEDVDCQKYNVDQLTALMSTSDNISYCFNANQPSCSKYVTNATAALMGNFQPPKKCREARDAYQASARCMDVALRADGGKPSTAALVAACGSGSTGGTGDMPAKFMIETSFMRDVGSFFGGKDYADINFDRWYAVMEDYYSKAVKACEPNTEVEKITVVYTPADKTGKRIRTAAIVITVAGVTWKSIDSYLKSRKETKTDENLRVCSAYDAFVTELDCTIAAQKLKKTDGKDYTCQKLNVLKYACYKPVAGGDNPTPNPITKDTCENEGLYSTQANCLTAAKQFSTSSVTYTCEAAKSAKGLSCFTLKSSGNVPPPPPPITTKTCNDYGYYIQNGPGSNCVAKAAELTKTTGKQHTCSLININGLACYHATAGGGGGGGGGGDTYIIIINGQEIKIGIDLFNQFKNCSGNTIINIGGNTTINCNNITINGNTIIVNNIGGGGGGPQLDLEACYKEAETTFAGADAAFVSLAKLRCLSLAAAYPDADSFASRLYTWNLAKVLRAASIKNKTSEQMINDNIQYVGQNKSALMRNFDRAVELKMKALEESEAAKKKGWKIAGVVILVAGAVALGVLGGIAALATAAAAGAGAALPATTTALVVAGTTTTISVSAAAIAGISIGSGILAGTIGILVPNAMFNASKQIAPQVASVISKKIDETQSDQVRARKIDEEYITYYNDVINRFYSVDKSKRYSSQIEDLYLTYASEKAKVYDPNHDISLISEVAIYNYSVLTEDIINRWINSEFESCKELYGEKCPPMYSDTYTFRELFLQSVVFDCMNKVINNGFAQACKNPANGKVYKNIGYNAGGRVPYGCVGTGVSRSDCFSNISASEKEALIMKYYEFLDVPDCPTNCTYSPYED